MSDTASDFTYQSPCYQLYNSGTKKENIKALQFGWRHISISIRYKGQWNLCTDGQ